jgi:hypothetical protein
VWVAGVPVNVGVGGSPAQAAGSPLDVPPVPPGAAGVVVLAAPDGMGSVRLDGRPLSVPAGGAVAVVLPAGYGGGQLSVLTGPVSATEVLGTPAAQGADAPPEPEVTDLPPLATVSAVLPLAAADPAGPAVLVDDPAAAG